MQRLQPTQIRLDLVVLVVALILFGAMGTVFPGDSQLSATTDRQKENGPNGLQKKKIGIKIGLPMTGKWVDTHIGTDNGQAVSTKWAQEGPALKDTSNNKPFLGIGGEFSLDLSEWMELKVGIDFSSDLYDDQLTGVAGMNINF